MRSLLVLALAGCHGAAPSGVPPECVGMVDQCFSNQQICVAGPKCAPCPSGQYAAQSNQCLAIGGTAIAHDFDQFTAQAGQEILGLCQSWTMNNATEVWVNAVELTQNEASHHSNWLFVPDDKFPGPDGVWNCKDRGYDQLSAALAGGVLYAQSTQATHEVQKFPDGAAVRIPPYARIISDVHILNASSQPVTGRASLVLYTLDKADVKTKLAPFHLTFETLDIPPHAQSRFTAECELDSSFQAAFNHPLDLKLYYSLPHTHALGRRFFLSVYGGPNDGQALLDVDGYNGEPRGRAYDPPIDLTGADGLRFGCEYDNPRDVPVMWGFGDQEMCEYLGFADDGLVFESSVHSLMATGTDGAVQTFTGPCATIAFKYNFDMPGGPPPDGGADGP